MARYEERFPGTVGISRVEPLTITTSQSDTVQANTPEPNATSLPQGYSKLPTLPSGYYWDHILEGDGDVSLAVTKTPLQSSIEFTDADRINAQKLVQMYAEAWYNRGNGPGSSGPYFSTTPNEQMIDQIRALAPNNIPPDEVDRFLKTLSSGEIERNYQRFASSQDAARNWDGIRKAADSGATEEELKRDFPPNMVDNFIRGNNQANEAIAKNSKVDNNNQPKTQQDAQDSELPTDDGQQEGAKQETEVGKGNYIQLPDKTLVSKKLWDEFPEKYRQIAVIKGYEAMSKAIDSDNLEYDKALKEIQLKEGVESISPMDPDKTYDIGELRSRGVSRETLNTVFGQEVVDKALEGKIVSILSLIHI